ncbi:MAG: HD-GYP domain-containing protein (c-di-GMP phosphodiesterase class II) [Pseudohongiellaceae bacterium]|jgi:HD-GYP domain-containing protein (c-di-GMP phosphodiesterase class II)
MTKAKRVKVSVDKLKPGIYVDTDLSWTEHPFLFRHFLIKSFDEIKVIKELGLTEIIVIPDKCKSKLKEEPTHSSAAVDKASLWKEKNKRIQKAAKYRLDRQKKSKEYLERVKQIKNLTSDLKNAPANAIRNARKVADLMSSAFETDSDVLINLVNFSDDDFSMHHHTLNVCVLTLAIAKAMGIKDIELRKLCIGAVLHDIGKVAVPAKVLMKKEPLNTSEQKLLDTHPLLGGKLARKLQGASIESAEVIEQHHEFLDGTGYPQGLRGDDITILARIVVITNCYDNLCNPADIKKAVTPKQAMAILYAKYKDKLDTEIVQLFIKTMGVYPPGTMVSLSDGSIGLVTAVSSQSLLQPQLLLYHPDVPKSEALYLDLQDHPELCIKDTLTSADLSKRIYDYLGVTERTCYFYDKLQ